MAVPALSQLTDKQQAFVQYMVSGLNQGEAARAAGYTSPDTNAYRLVRLPAVAGAIRAELERLGTMEMAPLAWGTLRKLCDEKMPPPVRLGAAKTILDRTGFTEKAGENSNLGSIPLAQMTEAQLLAVAARLRATAQVDARIPGQIIEHEEEEPIDTGAYEAGDAP